MAARSPSLASRRVAELTPQGRILTNGVTIGAARRVADENASGERGSLRTSGLRRGTNTVGHDPEDRMRVTVTQAWFAVLVQKAVPKA